MQFKRIGNSIRILVYDRFDFPKTKTKNSYKRSRTRTLKGSISADTFELSKDLQEEIQTLANHEEVMREIEEYIKESKKTRLVYDKEKIPEIIVEITRIIKEGYKPKDRDAVIQSFRGLQVALSNAGYQLQAPQQPKPSNQTNVVQQRPKPSEPTNVASQQPESPFIDINE